MITSDHRLTQAAVCCSVDHLEALDNFLFSKHQSLILSLSIGLSSFYYTMNIHELISANLTNWCSIARLWMTNCFNAFLVQKKLTRFVTGDQIRKIRNAVFIVRNYRSHRRTSLAAPPCTYATWWHISFEAAPNTSEIIWLWSFTSVKLRNSFQFGSFSFCVRFSHFFLYVCLPSVAPSVFISHL